jgi:chitinase
VSCYTSITDSLKLIHIRFCGTTTDFCDSTCQSNCDAPAEPSCPSSGSSSTARTIGYFESWSTQRSCDARNAKVIDASSYKHINFAFALIDTSTFEIAQMASYDVALYTSITDLKSSNSALKVWISVGGWDAGGEVCKCQSSSSTTSMTS